ncbi:MAG: AAA family ATPase [Erysipelotrichaceae bacterium]|nr:AAA family ATPase [Erysipelotrichaceae bacterium]
MSEKLVLDNLALQNFIQQYKSSFSEHRLGKDYEIYKWIAVKHFQDNWDIEAVDFAAMIQNALLLTTNLLASKQFYPRGTIEMFARSHPERVRQMFKKLFDESRDLITRSMEFENEAIELLQYYPDYKQTHQNPNSISTYLWLRYPDKYYIFKYSVLNDIAQKIFGISLPAGKWDRMKFGFEMQDIIADEIGKDSELLILSQNSLNEKCYNDPQHKILTIDVGYFIGKHKLSVSHSKATENYSHQLNMILYGPPGTGKTYHTVHYAVAIIEKIDVEKVKTENFNNVYRRYMQYKNNGLIAFTTFHQSFGYEEFIEGIRPILYTEDSEQINGEIEYIIHSGIFKSFCENARISQYISEGMDLEIGKSPTIWKVSLESTGDNHTRKDCMDNNYIRIGWDAYGDNPTDQMDFSFGGKRELVNFYNKMQIGDLVFSCYSESSIDAIGVITSEPKWNDDFTKYKRVRGVKWLVKGINKDIVEINNNKVMAQSTVYRLSVSIADCLDLLKKVNPALFSRNVEHPNHVFIIDEINRGNISKIFGELITLIEPSKRLGNREQLQVTLPYSGLPFGVPGNVYILGTMNTADRSIAILDTALRRRFDFIEMEPQSSLLSDIIIEGIDVVEMMDTINRRIHVLLDREHTIGHSYFLSLRDNPSIQNLSDIFENKIIPLLQEYFYDDYEKIQLVLGDNQKSDDVTKFITRKNDVNKLFGNTEVEYPNYYQVNHDAFRRIEAYAYFK